MSPGWPSNCLSAEKGQRQYHIGETEDEAIMIKMRQLTALIATFASLAGLSLAPAHAQTAMDVDSAVGVAIDSIARKPRNNQAPTIIVVDSGVPVLRTVLVSGRPAIIMSRAKARDEQRAWFISLHSVEPTPAGLQIIYGTPANGYSGSVVVDWNGSEWVVKSREESHSSSGARYFYGELYEGVVCRDGTEMAQRWTATLDFMELVRTRQPIPNNLPKTSGICPDREFPDVVTYRQIKQMRRR